MRASCPSGARPSELAFRAPPLRRSGPVEEADLARVARVLRIGREAIVDSQWVDNGPGWVAVMLASAEAVLAVRPAAPTDDEGSPLDIGMVGPYAAGSPCAYEVRAIFADDRGRIVEDPVTGSLNASLAQWLVGSGRFEPPYLASQGTLLGRTGRPRISRDPDGSIWVGGATHTLVEGELRLVGQATVTTTEWWPRAPSGAGGVTSSVWTSPLPSVARTRMVWSPAAAAAQGSVHCTQVASVSGAESSAGCQSPSSMETSTALTPRSGAQATPAMATLVPAATVLPLRGTSMRDCVRMGASLAQPRGTQ